MLATVPRRAVATDVVLEGIVWSIVEADRPVEAYVRSIVHRVAMIIGFPALLILLERELADRWNPLPVAIRTNLMALFMGSPSHVQYPRALGASVGKGVTVLDVQ